MKNIIISVVYLVILFSLSRFVFDPAYLYYEIWWLDIPMHVMGGFGIAALAGAFFTYRGIKVSYWKLFIAYLIAAVTWEMYEYVYNAMSFGGLSEWFDTMKDIIDGWIGMSIAYLFIRK